MPLPKEFEIVQKLLDDNTDASLDAADALLTKIEKVQRAAANGSGAAADEEDEEESDEDDLQKLGARGRPRYPGDPIDSPGIVYPRDDLTDSFAGGADDTPITPTTHPPTSGTYATGVTPVVQPPARHAFDDEVDRIKLRDGSSRMAAMTTARLENPALYTAYQQFLSRGQTTSQQAMARSRSTHPVHKTYEDAVEAEISKGFDPVTAGQRILHSYGSTLPHRNDEMAKAANTITTKFMRLVDEIMIEKNCDRTSALRLARQEDEDLFGAYQLV